MSISFCNIYRPDFAGRIVVVIGLWIYWMTNYRKAQFINTNQGVYHPHCCTGTVPSTSTSFSFIRDCFVCHSGAKEAAESKIVYNWERWSGLRALISFLRTLHKFRYNRGDGGELEGCWCTRSRHCRSWTRDLMLVVAFGFSVCMFTLSAFISSLKSLYNVDRTSRSDVSYKFNHLIFVSLINSLFAQKTHQGYGSHDGS